MNATTFFSRDTFERIRKDVLAEIEFSIEKYRKTYRTHGNSYSLGFHASRYKFSNNEYFVSMWYDYNYPGQYQSRNIGGGTGRSIPLDSYDSFCAAINDYLRKYPDFKEPVFVEEQLSWF